MPITTKVYPAIIGATDLNLRRLLFEPLIGVWDSASAAEAIHVEESASDHVVHTAKSVQ
jgi:hypothetical protein